MVNYSCLSGAYYWRTASVKGENTTHVDSHVTSSDTTSTMHRIAYIVEPPFQVGVQAGFGTT